MENQRNVTIIFNPHLSDKSPHKDEIRPLPVCVTVSFTNLPTNLSGETLMRTFAGHLQRSWEEAESAAESVRIMCPQLLPHWSHQSMVAKHSLSSHHRL